MDKELTWAFNFAVEKDVWFVSYWYNFLCRYDINLGTLECIQLPIKNTVEGLFNGIVKTGDTIIMIPSTADVICLYSVIDSQFLIFPIKKMQGDKFLVYSVYKEYIYMFPNSYPYIIKFNLQNYEIEYLNFMDNEQVIQVGLQGSTYGQYAYLTQQDSNAIIIYNLENETYERIEIGQPEERYSSILKVQEGEVWLTNQSGEIIIYDLNSSRAEKISIQIPEFEIDSLSVVPCFLGNMEHGDFVYFFPGKANMIIKVNKYTRQIEKAIFSDMVCQDGDNIFGWHGSLLSIPQKKDVLYIFNLESRSFFSVDLETGNVDKREIKMDSLSDEELKGLFEEYGSTILDEQSRGVYLEMGAEYLNLHNFIKVKVIEKSLDYKKQHNENIGEMIYQQM